MNLLKQKATRLRKSGWSYSDISDRINVSRGTLSSWLRDVHYVPNRTVLRRIKSGPLISGERRHQKKIEREKILFQEASEDISALSQKDIFYLGLGLYIGEGSKTHGMTTFSNADPRVLLLMMRWFREICFVPEKNFRAILHTYPDIDQESAKKYWSEMLNIPLEQFYRIVVDRRAKSSRRKMRVLPYGTMHVRVLSCGDRRFGVELFRRIHGWISAIHDQAGIV